VAFEDNMATKTSKWCSSGELGVNLIENGTLLLIFIHISMN